jgi:isoaspartyl peptidase/L-asparaginase-like protein (Ntn-hydrolase superfamily)
MLVGDAATEFATSFGFLEEDLSSPASKQEWQDWQQTNCQPNFWTVGLTLYYYS